MITVCAAARCQGCPWTAGPGDWLGVDKAAEAHTRRSQHPTGTMAAVGYEASEAARSAERSRWQRDATRRAAAALIGWAERHGHADDAVTVEVLRLAAQLQQRTSP